MDKKEKRRKLLILNHLVNIGGDKDEIEALRAELGVYDTEAKETTVEEKELENLDLLAQQYIKLRAFEMYDSEIMFVLCIGHGKLARIRDYITDDGIKEGIKSYDNHRAITNYRKARKKRWKNL